MHKNLFCLMISAVGFVACGEQENGFEARDQAPGAPALQAEQTSGSGEVADEPMQTRTRVVQDQVHPLTVRLDTSTVLCSEANYGTTFLKVLIPEIANVTLFDHRNSGVEAPCIAAGMCTRDLNVDTLLGSCASHPTEEIELRVLLTAHYVMTSGSDVCKVHLVEELFTTIRGVDFYHLRDGAVSERPYEDCLGI